MRLVIYLALCVWLAACAPPIDLEIPEDHPANPQAGVSPSNPAAAYRYRLPPPPLAEPSGLKTHSPMDAKEPSHRHKGPSHTEKGDMEPATGGHHGH